MTRLAAPLVAAVGCATLTAILAVSRALDYSFWQDEVGTARVITRPGPIEMLRNVTSTELHPPGFYTLGWLLSRAGAPAAWGRAISVVAAIALTVAIVFCARRFVPLWGAALAGLLTALGWQFLDHSWELRPYSLFALVCVLFALALEQAAERPTRGRLTLLAVVVAAGVMTHYFFAFTLGAGLIWLASVRVKRPLLIAIGAGLLPLVLWLPALYKQYHGGGYKWIGSFQPRAVAEAYASLFYRAPVGYALGLLVLGIVLVGALRLWRHSDAGALWALCAVVPVLVAAVVWATGHEIFLPRNLIGAAPFAAVAIVAAIASLPRLLALPAMALVGLLVVAGYLHSRGPIVPAYDRVAAALVQEGWQEGDPIVLFGPRYSYLHPLDWYLPGARLELASLNGTPCSRIFVVGVGGQGRALTAADTVLRVSRVVIARVAYRPSLASDVRSRGGSVLATRASSCARVA